MDPALGGVHGLFGLEGKRALAGFLEERGFSLVQARPVQAFYSPGKSCLVRYRVRAQSPKGSERFLHMCAETRARPKEPLQPQRGFADRHGFESPIGRSGGYLVWVYPYDPTLAGLPTAAWGPAIKSRVPSKNLRDGFLGVRVKSLRYRPRRRAVFRYSAITNDKNRSIETFYGKVLRREKARRSVGVARLAASVSRREPEIDLGWPTQYLGKGVLLFDPLPGRNLREILISGGSLPSPDRLARLLSRLPAIPNRSSTPDGSETSRSMRDAVEGTAPLLKAIIPWSSGLVEEILQAVSQTAESPKAVVHGDFYEGQVFVNDDFSLGLIDLDDFGLGDPLWDAANFCAHLIALALSAPLAAPRLRAYRKLVRRAFLNELGASSHELSSREGGAMMLLATGPFRVLDPLWPAEVEARLRLAVRLLHSER